MPQSSVSAGNLFLKVLGIFCIVCIAMIGGCVACTATVVGVVANAHHEAETKRSESEVKRSKSSAGMVTTATPGDLKSDGNVEAGYRWRVVTKNGLTGKELIDMDYNLKIRLYHQVILLEDKGVEAPEAKKLVAKNNNVTIKLLDIISQDACLNNLPLPEPLPEPEVDRSGRRSTQPPRRRRPAGRRRARTRQRGKT